MADLILKVLDSYSIKKDRVLIITNNNISNNKILIKYINNTLNFLGDEFCQLFCIPYLTYIIQLALKELVVYLKIKLKNNKVISEWINDE